MCNDDKKKAFEKKKNEKQRTKKQVFFSSAAHARQQKADGYREHYLRGGAVLARKEAASVDRLGLGEEVRIFAAVSLLRRQPLDSRAPRRRTEVDLHLLGSKSKEHDGKKHGRGIIRSKYINLHLSVCDNL